MKPEEEQEKLDEDENSHSQVKEQINYVNNLDDLTQLSETVSEDGDVLYSMNSTLQVEPLDVECKGRTTVCIQRGPGARADYFLPWRQDLADNPVHSVETNLCVRIIILNLHFRLEIENAKLKTIVKKQVDKVEQLQKTLSSTRLIDHLPAELGAGCSQCLHLDATYQVLQRELLSMKGWQRKCEKLEKESRKLEQEVVKLKSHTELKMIEHTQVEQYKREIEERARQDLIEKLKEVNLFLQEK
nr:ankyrin repeat domain-containing protein 26-like [Odocoileus virginianus texanus]